MKIELNLDLEDFMLDEDGTTLKEELQEQIKNTVIDRMVSKIENGYTKNLDEIIVKRVEEMTDGFFNDFITREIVVTDGYGRNKESGTIEQVVKSRFDKWINETVDERGRDSTSSYDKLTKQVNYLIEEQMKKRSSEFMQNTLNQVTDKLEEKLSEDMRDMIGKRIADKIGLNKILPKLLKK